MSAFAEKGIYIMFFKKKGQDKMPLRLPDKLPAIELLKHENIIEEDDGKLTRIYHQTVKKVTNDFEALGTVLNIKPVLKFDVSTLDVYQKCRGFNKARKVMIEAMKNDLNTKFEKWYKAGKVNLLAASSASPEVTKEWEAQIREEFPGMDVRCDDLSMGVACHIGYGGLGIGCSCCPDAALD